MTVKQLVTLSGAVEQVNAKGTGIKLLGEWLNVSQYHPVMPMPTPGELVEVQVETTDRGQWINSLRILGGGSSSPSSAPGRDVEIRRQVAMQSAAQLTAAMRRSLARSRSSVTCASSWSRCRHSESRGGPRRLGFPARRSHPRLV